MASVGAPQPPDVCRHFLEGRSYGAVAWKGETMMILAVQKSRDVLRSRLNGLRGRSAATFLRANAPMVTPAASATWKCPRMGQARSFEMSFSPALARLKVLHLSDPVLSSPSRTCFSPGSPVASTVAPLFFEVYRMSGYSRIRGMEMFSRAE